MIWLNAFSGGEVSGDTEAKVPTLQMGEEAKLSNASLVDLELWTQPYEAILREPTSLSGVRRKTGKQ